MKAYNIKQKNQSVVELIQFTDMHILEDEGACFDGVDTYKSFQSVIEMAKLENWPPDAVILTGDLVHQANKKTYQRLAGLLTEIECPVIPIPGNHDDPVIMSEYLDKEPVVMTHVCHAAYWSIILLNTFQAGTHSGFLEDDEIRKLETLLDQSREKNCLICLHHPPVSIQSPWMDAMSLQNPEALFNVTDQFDQVRGILWGHIHQAYSGMRNGVRLMASPSTCVQFMPQAESYQKDDQSAGYRIIRLTEDGRILSTIKRL